jgi:D-psicose/D-tagatose/L-ribulose 3-epimerase
MNQLGIHMLVFTGEWNPATARDAFARAKRAGYDALEVLILDYETIDTGMTADLAAEYGLKVVAASTGTREADIGSPDPAVVKRGEDLLLRSIELAVEMGSTELGGPGFSAVARYSSAPPAGAFDQAVKSYTRVADAARAAGIRVGLEALNRYESNFINTLDQAAQVVRAAGPDALFVHADLFHMNIEEANLGEAFLGVKDVLGYVHVAESNRGPLGTGNTDWKLVFGTLGRMGYTGPITFETFSPSVLGPELANLVALWRDPWPDPDQVALDGRRFIAQHIAEAKI